jgi:tRNA 2-thiouridine synthesizing protein B
MLFIINKSPFTSKSLESCLQIAKEGDSILFIEDGVFAAHMRLEKAEEKGVAVYLLEADTEARGVTTSLPVVDYRGFVDLVETDTVVSWM